MRKDPEYLAWIRTLPCCLTGAGQCVAHHLLSVPFTRGMAYKADDMWAVPLTPEKHVQLHDVDKIVADTEEQWFWNQNKVLPHILARSLYALRGDYEAAEHLIRRHGEYGGF